MMQNGITMQEQSLLNRSLRKLRNLVTELQHSNNILQTEKRHTRERLDALREVHNALQQKEKRLRRIMHKMEILLNNSHQGYVLLDKESRVVSFNHMSDDVTFAWLGMQLQEGKSILDYAPPDLRDAMRHFVREAMNGTPMVRERKTPERMGDRWFRLRYDPVRDDNGIVEYVLLSYIELTEEVKLRLTLEEKERQALVTQQRIVESEANLKAIIDNSHAYVYSLDREYRYITFNEPLARKVKAVFGHDLQRGENAMAILTDPNEIEEYKTNYDKALAGQRVQSVKEFHLHGNTLYHEYTLSPIQTEQGVIGLSCFVIDITERVRTEELLQHSVEQLQRSAQRRIDILNALPANIALLDHNGVIVSVNKAWREFAMDNEAPDADAYIGINYFDVCTPMNDADTDGALVAKGLSDVIDGRALTFSHEYACHSSTEKRWFRVEITPLNGHAQNGVVVMHINITDRKLKEEELRASNELYDLVSLATNDTVWDWNLATNELWMNENLTNTFGHRSGTMTLADWESHIHPDDLQRVLSTLNNSLQNRKPVWEGEYRYLHANGDVVYVYDRGYVIFDSNGQPLRMVGAMQDITERVKQEESIRRSEAHLKESQRVARIGSWQMGMRTTDPSSNPVTWSDETYRLFGHPPGAFEPSYEKYLAQVHPDDLARVVKTVETAFAQRGNLDYETRIVLPDGDVRIIYARADIEYDSAANPVSLVGTVQDITDRKRAEQVETEMQLRLKAIFNGTTDAILLTDDFGQYQQVNPAAVRMLGYTEDEFREKFVTDLVVSVTVDETNLWDEFQKDGSQTGVIELRRKDGNIICCHYNAKANILPGLHVSILTDITERKQAELEREQLTSELIEKNKGLEQFAYIVSHNLRAPVANIVGLSNILMRSDLQTLKRHEMMVSLNKSVVKLDDVIRDLNTTLQLKNASLEKAEPVSLKETIDDIVTSLEQTMMKENALVEMHLQVDEVKTIRTYLYSVLQNLITNSLKYRKTDVTPVISIESCFKNDKLVITYTDNGLGMDLSKVGDKVFGMYKRFHNHVDGKGMGLFMVKTQVETLGGKIFIDSKLNEGTTFTITLPL